MDAPTVHASAVLAGARAVLIRGPAGAGKSRLLLALIQAAETGLLRLAAALAGLVEIRGVGIARLDHEPVAVVGLVVDLAAGDAERLPVAAETVVCGVRLRRLAVAAGADPLPPVLAVLRLPAAAQEPFPAGSP
jgi:serine kinase of HPr protein (carbohydrate metabolism regulator)